MGDPLVEAQQAGFIDIQDADGSWWDYPLYNYHQQYGTAYAIMSLHRCRRPRD